MNHIPQIPYIPWIVQSSAQRISSRGLGCQSQDVPSRRTNPERRNGDHRNQRECQRTYSIHHHRFVCSESETRSAGMVHEQMDRVLEAEGTHSFPRTFGCAALRNKILVDRMSLARLSCKREATSEGCRNSSELMHDKYVGKAQVLA